MCCNLVRDANLLGHGREDVFFKLDPLGLFGLLIALALLLEGRWEVRSLEGSFNDLARLRL